MQAGGNFLQFRARPYRNWGSALVKQQLQIEIIQLKNTTWQWRTYSGFAPSIHADMSPLAHVIAKTNTVGRRELRAHLAKCNARWYVAQFLLFAVQ